MLSGENSILNRATTAKETTGQKQIEERVSLAYNAAVMEDINNGNGKLQDTTLSAELAKLFPGSEIEIDTTTDTTGKKWYVTIDGGTPIEVEAGKAGGNNGIDITTLQTATTKPYIPENSDFHVSEVATEQTIAGGLVITDGTNEFVWVEVPMTYGETGVYKNAGEGITDFSNENCLKIAKDLAVYSESTLSRNPSALSDHLPPAEKVGNVDYTDNYKAVLQSIYKNGGFWIGRYETGIQGTETSTTSARDYGNDYSTEHPTSGIVAVIKKDVQPYTWVRWGQAQTLAQGISSGTRTSSLLMGVQWDLVLKFLEKNGDTDSHDWGNYRDSVFSLKEESHYAKMSSWTLSTTWKGYNEDETGFVESSEKKSQSSDGNGILYTTGANTTNNSKKNICDIAGNVFEWTIENTSNTDYPCAGRGGGFVSTGSNSPASSRYYRDTSSSNYGIGFRVSLY